MPRFKRFKRRHRRTRRPKKGMVKLIKKVIRSEAEQKFHEFFATDTNITDANSANRTITVVPQGVGFGDRIGIEFQPDLLNIRFHLRLLSNPKPISARVFIIQNMVDDNPQNIPTTMGQLMPNLQQSVVPYRLLYDKSFDMSLGARSEINVQLRIRGSRMKSVKFTGSGTTVYTQGKILFHIITDNDVADILTNDLNSRLVFHDT